MKNVALLVAGLVMLAAVLAAQTAAAPPDNTTQALVTELRALRGDLNRIAGASIRTQLLVGRLQLQEQRILSLSRQMEDVQKELAGVAQARVAIESQFKQMEAASDIDPARRDDHDRAVDGVRQQVAEARRREQQLREQEMSLSAHVAEEQTRWTDFSSRLDELERTLQTPRPR